MKLLFELSLIKGVLVVAPLRAVLNVWPAEIAKWKDFNDLTWACLHGDEKDEHFQEDFHFYFINPEGLPWLHKRLMATNPRDWPFDVLIVDESTKFRAPRGVRFKLLKQLLPRFRRRYILTGTPTPKGLIDLFGQIYLLDLGGAFTPWITHYRNTYFYPSGYGGYTWSPQPDALERILEKIHPLVLRMRREDYLQLPPLIPEYRWLELPPKARDIYRDLEEHFIALLGDDALLAPNAAAAGMKCRQVLNGAVYTNSEHDWTHIHDIKLDALVDLVEELSGQPLLILYEFNHDRERIIAKLDCPALGQQSMKKDSELIKQFNEGKIQHLLGHPASMGHALNLQGNCAHVCWFGLTWNLEHYDQAIQRVWRQGNDAPRVFVHHLCIRNSLDENVIQTLEVKDRNQTNLMEGILRLQKSKERANILPRSKDTPKGESH